MRYNRLGRSGLYVSELCLGTMTFGTDVDAAGMYAAMGSVTQADATKLVERALAGGINFIDTADVYSYGRSESQLGQALKDLGATRSEVVLATKFYGLMGPGPNNRGASRGHIMDSVALSLERLQTDYVDLYQVHADDLVTPIDETLRALDDLVSQGLVRYIGVSNQRAYRVMKALGISERRGWARYDSVQAYYSIAGRDLEHEIVPLLQEEQVGLMVWSPLAGGLLSGKFGPGAPNPEDARRANFDFPPVDRELAWRCVAAMREIADARGVSVARVALAWVLAKPFVTSVIIGAKRVEQVEDNLAATDLNLTADELARLDEVSAPSKTYPGWMIERQGGWRVPPPFKPQA
jgi:aryl-alcohol dehydrogenase-like predicted oxidoreductase